MTDAFSGVRILDFTQLEQGPSATQVLADFGADVIKVERIDRGEIGRGQAPLLNDGYSPHWSATNRNKRSISVDVKSDDGRELILELARDADIVASNFRPGVMDRLGLGWEQLSEVNPQIIVAYASGYGISGPYVHRRGQDLAAQAMSGLMALTGDAQSGPVPTGTFMVDYLASMQFAQGMMIALAARERTGRGQVVDSNLLNAAVTSHLQEGTTYLNTGQQFPRPTGGVAHAHNTALYGYYEAADGLWLALIGEFYVDEQWKRTARACGLSSQVIEDLRFQTIEGLLEHTEETHRLIADAVGTYPRDEIMARFEAEDVLVAPVHDYDSVFTDPQVQHNGLVLEAEIDGVGPVKFVGMPIALSQTPARLRHVPPKIGEHNDEVLSSAGIALERIRSLKDAGVIGTESDRERSGGPGAWSLTALLPPRLGDPVTVQSTTDNLIPSRHSSTEVILPTADGGTFRHRMHEPVEYPHHPAPFTSRRVLAAAHIVADPRIDYIPGQHPKVDWEATIAFRRHLFSYGIGIAEGMDTSERGPGGLDWSQAQELIRLGASAAHEAGADLVSGAGTDQITSVTPSLSEIVEAYIEQLEFVQAQDSAAVIRASHALAHVARSEDDYLWVYREVLARTDRPAIVHWLGTGFDPSLEGYWGYTDPQAAMDVVVRLAEENTDRLDGIKFSLLDHELEQEFRRRLPSSVKVYTGDDYDYTDLLLGDGQHHSHGLLGVLDPIAPLASAAFTALDADNKGAFTTVMNRSIPLATKMFEAPADRYKVGTVFVAWLSGHQDHFRMVSGREGMRSLRHLCDLFVLTDRLGLLPDPELAAHRMRLLLARDGVG